MVLSPHHAEALKKRCPELRLLPEGWTFNVTLEGLVYYTNHKTTPPSTTWNHPNLGPLPKPWILKVVNTGTGQCRPVYYNKETRKQSKDDPRNLDSTLKELSKNAPRELRIAASRIRNSSKHNPGKFKRTPINEERNIRDQYEIIHTIDDGKGGIGGMNGGVFVVVMKNVGRIFIEKRFKEDAIAFARNEIEMMYRVNHAALTGYSAAFILEDANPPQASLYMEFCDRGSLADLIRTYATRRINGDRDAIVPEGFVWHALCGLVDALAYLQCGVSVLHNKHPEPPQNWIPILHRDIKPDNVFIKSRSTLGTKNYFYVILSDFGLACEDRPDEDPLVDKYQRAGSQLGTPTWIAPELCYYPYPATPQEEMYFPPGHKHSKRSDLWAVGASIYNLCEFNNNTAGLSHIDMSRRYRYPGISTNTYVVGTVSRKRDLLIPSHYSQELREVVWEASCWDVNHRHSPVSWCRYAHPLLVSSGFSEHGENCKDLPEWATRIHEYMSKAEKLKSRGR